jgi:putative membrane protein
MAEPDMTTKLAFERTRVAYDRTAMSAIRTATSLITFGFSIYKFFQLEHLLEPSEGPKRLIGSREFAIALVGLGLISLLLGAYEHREGMRRLRADWPGLPRSRTGLLTTCVGILGIVALIIVICRR